MERLDDDAKAPAAKHLAKWRPHVLASESKPSVTPDTNRVIKSEDSKDPPLQAVNTASKISSGDGEQLKGNQGALPVAAAG